MEIIKKIGLNILFYVTVVITELLNLSWNILYGLQNFFGNILDKVVDFGISIGEKLDKLDKR